jgi:hypothetical protein
MAVSRAILSGLAIAGEEYILVLRTLKSCIEEAAHGEIIDWPIDFDGDQASNEGGSSDFPDWDWNDTIDAGGGDGTGQTQNEKGTNNDKPPPSPRLSAPPVGSYTVISDDGSAEVEQTPGGLIPRPSATMTGRESQNKGGNGRKTRKQSSAPPGLDTEQRAVELVVEYVLDPEGIFVNDTRWRKRVGADLVGDDGVVREIKARSGQAGGRIELTEHEYKRAGSDGMKYELIIVENVWTQPVITVIRHPLGRLDYYPTGGVVVTKWANASPPPRVIRLLSEDSSQPAD